jgi:hypothetical protein
LAVSATPPTVALQPAPRCIECERRRKQTRDRGLGARGPLYSGRYAPNVFAQAARVALMAFTSALVSISTLPVAIAGPSTEATNRVRLRSRSVASVTHRCSSRAPSLPPFAVELGGALWASIRKRTMLSAGIPFKSDHANTPARSTHRRRALLPPRLRGVRRMRHHAPSISE